jgi:transposase
MAALRAEENSPTLALSGVREGGSILGGCDRSFYDNDRCLVARILPDGARERATLFSGFLSHYLIRSGCGRPGKGDLGGRAEGASAKRRLWRAQRERGRSGHGPAVHGRVHDVD